MRQAKQLGRKMNLIATAVARNTYEDCLIYSQKQLQFVEECN